jgi:RecJ-like exonuclease
MKISVNDQELYTLSDTQKQVIMNEIPEDIFDTDMKRRLHYILTHKYDQCFKALKAEWDPKLLANGVAMVPTDPDAYAKLVFAQPNYKNRSAHDNQIEAQ